MNKFIEGKRGYIEALINDVLSMKLEPELIEKPIIHVINGKENIEATFLSVAKDEGMDQDRINVILLGTLVYNNLLDPNFKEEIEKRVENVVLKEFTPAETMEDFVKSMLLLENDLNLIIVEEKKLIDYDLIFNFLSDYMVGIYQVVLENEKQTESENNGTIDKSSFVKED